MALRVFDATFLTLLTDDLSPAPPPPAGVHDTARDRLKYLLETLEADRIDLVLPTPVLAELLSLGRTDFDATYAALKGLSRIRVEGFGERAALECGLMLRNASARTEPKAKVKFDHQIVAIAKVVGADTVYSDDDGVQRLSRRAGLACFGVWELPPRPVDPQGSMSFEPHA
jgi:hypothetical protein